MKLQAQIDLLAYNPEALKVLVPVGLSELNNGWDGQVKRLARARSAYHTSDELTLDSLVYPRRDFGSIALIGHIPLIRCVNIDGRFTVVLPFFSPTVVGPRLEIEASLVDLEFDAGDADVVLPLDRRLARPIAVPVEEIENIFIAA